MRKPWGQQAKAGPRTSAAPVKSARSPAAPQKRAADPWYSDGTRKAEIATRGSRRWIPRVLDWLRGVG
jgi:hypothetical protein